MQLNCTYSNYTQAAATCSAAQQYSTFTVQILYKLYSMQLNCNYSNYPKVPLHVQLHNSTAHLLYKYCTNCTVCNWTVLTVITHNLPLHVQRHNSTEHLLYKLYILQLNCTYSNYTEAAATCSAAQHHTHLLHKYCTNCTFCNW